MSRLETDLADLATFHRAKMSSASIAPLLGRSVTCVEREVAQLERRRAAVRESAPETGMAAPPRRRARKPRVVEAKAAAPASRGADPELCNDLRIPCRRRDRPVTRRTLGFIRRFLAADWSSNQVALLFDLTADELGQALEAAA